MPEADNVVSGPRVLASNSRTNGGVKDNLIKRLKHTVCFIIILATMFVAAAVEHRHLLFHIYILFFFEEINAKSPCTS